MITTAETEISLLVPASDHETTVSPLKKSLHKPNDFDNTTKNEVHNIVHLVFVYNILCERYNHLLFYS